MFPQRFRKPTKPLDFLAGFCVDGAAACGFAYCFEQVPPVHLPQQLPVAVVQPAKAQVPLLGLEPELAEAGAWFGAIFASAC